MKLIKIFSALTFIAVMMVSTPSCNAPEEKSDGKDTSSMKKDAPTPPTATKPANMLLVMHKVANYDKWLPIFEADDSAQKAIGLTRTVIGRGMNADSNMILIGFKMADYEKAKGMGASPELKAKMQKAGVMGAPTMHFEDMQVMDTTTNSMKDRIIIFSKVKDYDAWKKSYDTHSDVRRNGGVTDRAVAYGFDDKNNVTVVLGINDMDKAKKMIASPELRARMDSAGVVGKPDIFFYHVTKQY